MNAHVYQLNPNDAREGSGGSRGFISASGAYEGALTKAKHVTASTGAAGIEFEFESRSGEQARFSLYTHNKDGQPTYGMKQLQALMAVLKLRQITPVSATIEEYDFDTKAKQRIQAEIYRDLMGKPVGIVFQMEEYLGSDGTVKSRPNFFAPYEPNTKQLAVEILDQSKAEKLQKILDTLKDKKLAQHQAPPAARTASMPPIAPDFDDDIPF